MRLLYKFWTKNHYKRTSGSMWIKEVAKMTPPPKQSKTEVKVLFHILSSLKKYLPIFRGKNPNIRDPMPRSDIVIIFTVVTSMFVSNGDKIQNHIKDQQSLESIWQCNVVHCFH